MGGRGEEINSLQADHEYVTNYGRLCALLPNVTESPAIEKAAFISGVSRKGNKMPMPLL